MTKLYVIIDEPVWPSIAVYFGDTTRQVNWRVVSEDGSFEGGVSSDRDWARFDSGLISVSPRGDSYGNGAMLQSFITRYPDGFELIEAPGPDEQAWLAVQAAMALRAERAA